MCDYVQIIWSIAPYTLPVSFGWLAFSRTLFITLAATASSEEKAPMRPLERIDANHEKCAIRSKINKSKIKISDPLLLGRRAQYNETETARACSDKAFS